MVRAALYARVSTNNGQNPEMQVRELREYCERRGLLVAGEYVDNGVDAVLVYRYDRFARSLRQLVNALEEFRSLGIDFISLHEGVDTSTPNGRLVFGIFASIAEFERELIRERVKSGIAAARARGKRLGRPRRVVDSARIASLRAHGVSWRKIAADLGIGVGTARERLEMRAKNV
jgi:DNA invertase Pin-like site-specific DNA recombinase